MAATGRYGTPSLTQGGDGGPQCRDVSRNPRIGALRMTIAPYLREIGRGKDGARSLTREQAADLMARLLDGQVSDVEAGAFAIAMRIKGETPQELAGFMDAV